MSVNIRYPNITASTEKEQLSQIKSYLHQLVEQLNYALPTLGDGTGSAEASYEVQGGEMSYYELRSLIIQELQEVDRLFEELSQKMQADYVSDEELPKILEDNLKQAKESGEFSVSVEAVSESTEDGGINTVRFTDGKSVNIRNGTQGGPGEPGEPGEPGRTPEKGVDYFTEEDVIAVADQAAVQLAEKISFTLDEDGNLYYEIEEG